MSKYDDAKLDKILTSAIALAEAREAKVLALAALDSFEDQKALLVDAVTEAREAVAEAGGVMQEALDSLSPS